MAETVSTRLIKAVRQQLDCLLETNDIIAEQLNSPAQLTGASTNISDAIICLTVYLEETERNANAHQPK